jgi:hypothetical protein
MRGKSQTLSQASTIGARALPFVLGMLVAAFSNLNPNTPAGQAEIAGQKCNLCILQNPGDGSPCYAICMQKEEDQAAAYRARINTSELRGSRIITWRRFL